MKTPENREYAKRVSHYEDEDGLALLKLLARQKGVTATALLRLLVREEAKRRVVQVQQQAQGTTTASEP
jgi:hypothetical protein